MQLAAVLSGELGLLSLFDLGQLLMLNGATGQMVIVHEGRRAYLYFDRGQIVNAIDDEYHEGELAAYRLFTWKTGTFEFLPGPPSGSRAITESTEGLMMEAARRMDEDGTGGPGGPGGDGGEVGRLAQRASSLEALREAFQWVASETRGLPGHDDDEGNSSFTQLRGPDDALLFRPGHAPRLRVGGAWRAAGQPALDPAAYDQLRTRLLDGVKGPAGAQAREAGVHTCVVAGEDGRRYAIARVSGEHEALWVRVAGLPPPTPAQLDGPLDTWRGALATPAGLLLVAGPDAETTEQLFHATVAQLARTRGGTLLLAADHDRWAHTDEAGVLVRAGAGEAPALLRTLAPGTAAFDLSHADRSAEALHAAARVVAAVLAPDAHAALAHWCARVGRRWGDGIEAQLANGFVDVVLATAGRTADGRLSFGVTRLGFASAAIATPADGPIPEWLPAPATPPVAAPEPPLAAAQEAPPPAPAGPRAERATPAPPGPDRAADAAEVPADPMAALAAELTRSLRKAA